MFNKEELIFIQKMLNVVQVQGIQSAKMIVEINEIISKEVNNNNDRQNI